MFYYCLYLFDPRDVSGKAAIFGGEFLVRAHEIGDLALLVQHGGLRLSQTRLGRAQGRLVRPTQT